MAGRYRLIDRRGVGSTAEVYRTYDVKEGRVVAARLLTDAYAHDPVQQSRLYAHVDAYKRVAPHPMLLPVLDVVRTGLDRRTLVITELSDLVTVTQLTTTGPLPRQIVLDVASQIASLLEHLHAREVLARDLRAGSVFLGTSPGVTVRLSVDALAPGPICDADPVPALTGPAPHFAAVYASPERIRGEPGVAAGDIYALGAVIFEMLTARPIFQGSLADVLSQHLDAPVPVLRQIDASMPAALEALLARMLAKKTRFRPVASEVVRELESIRVAS